MKCSVQYGDETITFELIRKNVKNINLTVQPDQHIFVSANEKVGIEDIKAFVKERGRWILSKLNYFGRHRPYEKIPREYVSGETFHYLGRQYKLKVMEAEEDNVRFYRGTIEMFTTEVGDFQKKKRLLENWYDERRRVIFHDSLDRMYEKLRYKGIPKPDLHIRKMNVRWGSCLKREQKIIVNKNLIIAPKHCIDYVVLHELLHLKYPDHDYYFFNQLQLHMPDWKERKRILDEEVVREIR